MPPESCAASNRRVRSWSERAIVFTILAWWTNAPMKLEEIAEFAVNRMAIKTVIFDVEFTGYDFDPFSAIGYPGPFYPKGSILRWAINQYFRAAMSPRGLEDSYTTVIASLQRQRVIRHTPEGREVFPPEPPPDVPYDYRGAFNARLARYLNELLPALAPQRELWISQGFDHTPLRKMVELAATHGNSALLRSSLPTMP